MRGINFFGPILIVAGIFFGCATTQKLLPAYDEVLIYPLALDLTYLRTLEALENVDGWELEETEKEKGIINVRNIQHSRFDDADKRNITILLKRLGRKQTSIQLAPESQRVIGGDKLMERISEFVGREIKPPVAVADEASLVKPEIPQQT